jgi:hypothetical protein
MCHCSKDAAKNYPFKPHGAGVFQAVFPQRHAQLGVYFPFLYLFKREKGKASGPTSQIGSFLQPHKAFPTPDFRIPTSEFRLPC